MTWRRTDGSTLPTPLVSNSIRTFVCHQFSLTLMKFSVGEFRTNSWSVAMPNILSRASTVLDGGMVRMCLISTSEYLAQKEAILAAKMRPSKKNNEKEKNMSGFLPQVPWQPVTQPMMALAFDRDPFGT